MDKSKLISKFDRQARIYERQRKKNTLGNWRSKLLRNARGKVLELAVGAGANFSYYPENVEITAVDFSPGMLTKAKEAAKDKDMQIEFMLSDIEMMEMEEAAFDTVVSTLSFCGYDHPIDMLNKINRWCKPGGKILLMEHGISSNHVLALIQKGIDPIHYKMIGCHQKRNMMELIRRSNLQMEKIESHWQGIFHLIWATPGR